MARHEQNYRHFAIQAAEDLGYGQTVIEKIKKAENDTQISQIMQSARVSKEYATITNNRKDNK